MATDILLDENGDLRIENGDLVTGESEAQHIEHLMVMNKGEYKGSPLTGAGIPAMLKSGNKRAVIEREVMLQLERDGYKVKTLKINWPEINIDAVRKTKQ
jgi:hypothetical protein